MFVCVCVFECVCVGVYVLAYLRGFVGACASVSVSVCMSVSLYLTVDTTFASWLIPRLLLMPKYLTEKKVLRLFVCLGSWTFACLFVCLSGCCWCCCCCC